MQTENTTTGLKNISFSTDINAPKNKVWNALWDDENYKTWTAAFAAGSCAVTDWQEGSKVLFLDAKGDGMTCTIVKKQTMSSCLSNTMEKLKIMWNCL